MAGGQNVTIRAPKAASVRAMTSAYGRVIPLIYGKGRVQANVIYYTDFKATEHKSRTNAGGKGGGGSQVNIDYTYSVCVLFGLCEGTASGIGNVFVGKNKLSLADSGLSFFNGSSTQTAMSYITTNHPSEALNYRGTAYLGASAFSLGNDPSIPSVNAEVIGRLSGVNVGTNGSVDANPADVINDLLTDTNTGAGLSSSIVGSLTAMRTYCQAAEVFVSPVYTEARPAREMITALAQIANCGIYFSEGVVKFVPYGDLAITNNGTTYTPNLTPVYAITESDLIPIGGEPLKVNRKAQSDAYNHIKLSYQNRASDYNDDLVEAKDQASIEQFGDRLMSEVSLPEIADATIARRVAQQVLNRVSNIRNIYEFRVSWRFALLEPMDIVTLTEPGLGLNAEPVRIIEIEEDEDGFTIKAEEMQVGALHAAQYTTQASTGYLTNYNVAPGNTNTPVIFEPPMSLSGSPQLWIAASGGTQWGGCNVYVSDDNATYKLVGTISGKSIHGVLTATTPSGPATDTTNTVKVDLTVSGGTMVAGTTQNATDLVTLCYVGGELLAYRDATLTAANKYTLGYLIRGAYGSPIGSHATNDKFARLDATIFKYDYDKAFLGRTIYLKFQSFNTYAGGLQDLSTLTPVTYTFAGAQIPSVSGLALEQAFTGDSVKIKWTAVDGAVDYTVKVYDNTGTTLYRTVKAANNRYEYTWQDAIADGGPYRSLQLQVIANSKNGSSGAASSVTVSNPVPSALTGISATGGYRQIKVGFNADTSPDVAGYQIWMSSTSGFTPGSGNLIYDGPNISQTFYADPSGTLIPNGATTYYFRAAAYDKFGKTGLNVSSEFSATSLTLASGIGAGDITAAMIASGALDMTKFASGIRPPRVVSSLPTIDGTTYANGDTVVLTSDGKLYRAVSGAWTKATDGADITANSITAGSIAAGAIGATQIAASAVSSDKLLVTTRGSAINLDPTMMDPSAWANTYTYSFVTVTDGVSGVKAIRSFSARNTSYPATQVFALTAGKTYRVQAYVRQGGGTAGLFYLRCQRYTAANVLIDEYVSADSLTPTNTWTQYIGTFTAESNASYGIMYAYLNFGGTANGAYVEMQDFRIEEMLPATLIQDGAIVTNKLAANAVTASKIAAGTITANEIAANAIDATRIDSRNLTIKDGAGTVIFSAGVPLDAAYAATNVKNSSITIGSNGVLAGGGGGTVTIGGLGYSGDLNATYGARAGTTLLDSGGSVLSDSAVKNSAVTIGSNGVLSGAGGGTVTIGGLGYSGDLNATYGARAGTTLLDSGGSVLSDSAVKNSAVTIGSNGVLSGAGGGAVTIGGLGYTGDLNATYGARIGTNVKDSAGNTLAGDYQLLNATLDNGVVRVNVPAGGSLNVTSTTTGAIYIVLPRGWTYAMVRFTIQIYEYVSGGSLGSYEVGGYTYGGGPNNWYNTFANFTGSPGSVRDVTFCVDGPTGKPAIFIGTFGTTWQYPVVTIRNVSIGYGDLVTSNWDSGWGVFVTTSRSYSSAATIAAPTPGGKLAGVDQITAGNASTYIANAAINTAQIGSLNASVITAGTITTDRLVANAATNMSNASLTNNSFTVTSGNTFYSTGYSMLTFSATGSPVYSIIMAEIEVSGLPGAVDFIEVVCSMYIDGSAVGVTARALRKTIYTPSTGKMRVTETFTIPYRASLSSGSHSIGYNILLNFYDSSMAAINLSANSTLNVSSYLVVQENKV